MSLPQALADLQAKSREGLSEATLATMDQATADLKQSNIERQSLNVGDLAPAFSLPNALGQPVSLESRLQTGPVVISFYRGGWCPYCNLELRALQAVLSEIQMLGASLLAISPQTPDNSLSTQEKNTLSYEVLSDVGNQVARQFGLVFTLPASLLPIYADFGINLAAANGNNSFELPLPATYVVGTNGVIAHAFVDADYTKRLDPQEIIETLKKMPVKV